MTQPSATSGAYDVLPLRCGDYWYAVPLEYVVEVAAMVAIAPLPGTETALLGMANRGGEALPILDLRRWLGIATTPLTAQTLFVVARDGETKIGLVVDEVQPVRRYTQQHVKPVAGEAHWVSHSIHEGDILIQLLHMPALMSVVLRVMRT